ncbi:ABC transporter permease [Psychrobacter sp. APC 3426]|uniref:ABC transporter permease n=1 Tax=Psychrobacter sp. APC 3426 TaxID=3035177 RepID=UPI0025B5C471|nr:ABC transporter permease [Psychrobacter sp. APC 3426]MDN3398060.1 ABC transporter permease [Psychrobacter sp. APC 3426]
MSVQLPPYRPIKHRSGLKVMGAAFHALLMRELQTRFGGYRLGYLWAPLEVLFQVLIFLVIFGTIRERLVPGMDFSLFLVVGMVPFRMFQRIAVRALGAVDANKGLLMYRSIRHVDVIIARSFLELVIYFFTSILLLFGLAFFDIYANLENLHIVLFCWITLFIFSFGVALIMMVVGFYGGEISKVITIFFTILYFLSGIVYPIHVIPEPYFSYLLYNPFIHNIELMRHAFAPNYPAYHIDISYFLKWTFAVNFFGLLLYKYAERDMIRSR